MPLYNPAPAYAVFDDDDAGLVPASGGGTANFLRADGSWEAPPAGGTPPTGTGFRHITADTEDAASKLVEDADVHASAAIAQSKIADLTADLAAKAPTDATYIVQTANGSLSAEQALGALATGIVKNTTTTGVLSIAAQGTDYYAPSGTDVAIADGGTGASTAQAAIDALTAVSGVTNEHVLTKDTATGNAVFKAASVGGVSDGDKGDISVSASGATWTIDPDAVTYAKMQNVSATDKVLGRSTSGAGDVEEIACTAAGRAILDDADAPAQRTTLGLGTIATQAANNVSISGGAVTGITDLTIADGGTGQSTATAAFDALAPTTTQGDIIYHNGTDNVRLAKGTASQVLSMNAGATAPEWAAAPGGGSAATQAEQETGTSTTAYTSPGRQHFHPSAAKFWVKATANSTTIVVSYNMTSWADTNTGDADGTIATDFSSADWCGMVSIIDSTLAWDATFTEGYGFDAQAAGTFGVKCGKMQDGGTAAATVEDPDSWHVSGFGDLA